ncbi:MAG: septation protein IspZ, partial [Calditrichia bacterium]
MMIDRNIFIRNFALGLFPIIVFIFADFLFGLTTGLIVAIVVGIGQFLFTYFREKRLDAFILFDVSLIIVLGLISLVLHNDIFFKIKPGLVEM